MSYTDRDKPLEDPEAGILIYLKSTLFETGEDRGGLTADVYAYRAAHPEFPDESTGDQFFSERQFEAYRQLGFRTAHTMQADLGDWIAALEGGTP